MIRPREMPLRPDVTRVPDGAMVGLILSSAATAMALATLILLFRGVYPCLGRCGSERR